MRKVSYDCAVFLREWNYFCYFEKTLILMDERIIIPVSKAKLSLLLAISVVFVLLSAWLVVYSEADVLRKSVFALGIVFFGLGICVFVKKILGKKECLIIDQNGVTDNVTKPQVGTIKWEDIEAVEIEKLINNKMLLIFVKNPEEYLDKIEFSKRQGLNNNYSLVGTPFVIPSSILSMKLEDIRDLINERRAKKLKVIPLHHSH